MEYVYNMTVLPSQTKLVRYGATYTLENRTKSGDQMIYTFAAPGRETLLVVPHFAEQYRELEKFCQRFCFCKKLETAKAHIMRDVSRSVRVEKFPNDESSTGIMDVITVTYKDIKVEFHHMNNRLTLHNEFEIETNNLFGTHIRVLMDLEKEARKVK